MDVGAGLIYALVFVSLLHLTADGPDRYIPGFRHRAAPALVGRLAELKRPS